MFGKLPKHRKFDYTPHYYDPEKEERETGRKRIQFSHLRNRRQTKPYIWLIALAGFVIYLLVTLSKVIGN